MLITPNATGSLTPRSTRTQPALPTYTSLVFDSASSSTIRPPVGPVNFFRYAAGHRIPKPTQQCLQQLLQSFHWQCAGPRSTFSNGARVLHLASKTFLRQNQPRCELGKSHVFWLGLTARSTRTQPAPAVSSSNFPGFFAPAKIMSPAGPVNFFR